jgi:hypothetical protein
MDCMISEPPAPTDINSTSAAGTDTRKYTLPVKSIRLNVLRYDDLRDRDSEISFRKNRISVRRKIWTFRKAMNSTLTQNQ